MRHGPDDRLLVDTDTGSWSTRAVINATGTWTRPFWPRYPGQETFGGRQLHTADYRGPDEFAGKHVIVVGGGTSAVQLLIELAKVATTTWVTRRPPVFRSEPFTADYGRSVVAMVDERVRAGLPPESVVHATGLALTPEIREARGRGILSPQPMFNRITPPHPPHPPHPRRRLMGAAEVGDQAGAAMLDHAPPVDMHDDPWTRSGSPRCAGACPWQTIRAFDKPDHPRDILRTFDHEPQPGLHSPGVVPRTDRQPRVPSRSFLSARRRVCPLCTSLTHSQPG